MSAGRRRRPHFVQTPPPTFNLSAHTSAVQSRRSAAATNTSSNFHHWGAWVGISAVFVLKTASVVYRHIPKMIKVVELKIFC